MFNGQRTHEFLTYVCGSVILTPDISVLQGAEGMKAVLVMGQVFRLVTAISTLAYEKGEIYK